MKISVSSLRSFKQCRRAYELKYVYGLEPVKKAEALEVGSNYHEKIAELYQNGKITDGDFSKEQAMAAAYRKYIYPKFHMTVVEEWFNYQLSPDDVLIGRIDGYSDDNCLVEHKTTGAEITEEYEYNLQWDEQILAYMLATGTRKIYYTVIRKPTIRQKGTESEQEFYERMIAWYDTDTSSKIRLLVITRTDEEIEAFRKHLIQMCLEMRECYMRKSFYRNTCACNAWGRRCEYSSVCMYYNPEHEYIDFVKNDRRDKNGN
jgi:ATP-dependent helicase/DNAse subunit B